MAGQGAKASASVSVRPDVHDRLRAAAAERGLSVQYLASAAITDYLDRLIPVDELVLVRPATGGARRAAGTVEIET